MHQILNTLAVALRASCPRSVRCHCSTYKGRHPREQMQIYQPDKSGIATYAWACGGCLFDPVLQSAPQPGGSGSARISTPLGMAIGHARAATVFAGANDI